MVLNGPHSTHRRSLPVLSYPVAVKQFPDILNQSSPPPRFPWLAAFLDLSFLEGLQQEQIRPSTKAVKKLFMLWWLFYKSNQTHKSTFDFLLFFHRATDAPQLFLKQMLYSETICFFLDDSKYFFSFCKGQLHWSRVLCSSSFDWTCFHILG